MIRSSIWRRRTPCLWPKWLAGSACLLLSALPVCSLAQISNRVPRPPAIPVTPESTAKPGGGGQGGGHGQRLSDQDMANLTRLLDAYRGELAEFEGRFRRQEAPPGTEPKDHPEQQKVKLTADESLRLQAHTERFFRELAELGYTREHLQAFKSRTIAGGGGGVLFGNKQAWDNRFLAVERAEMLGRSLLVQRLWNETLREYFRDHPEAVGRVYGEIDIGSWVKLKLGGLGFDADIDFSVVATCARHNLAIRDLFARNLEQCVRMNMVDSDALLTAHGLATDDVFIGEWGKAFAEMDMLKRSTWKIIRTGKDGQLVLDKDGNPEMVTRRGQDLFWEDAFRQAEFEEKQKTVEFPKIDIEKEPMLSLEMLRHEVHDIEHGPFERGAKLVKILKYLERSYHVNRKALAPWRGQYAEPDPALGDLAARVIKAKEAGDMQALEQALAEFAGDDLSERNVDEYVRKIEARAQAAMHDNACRALAFRLQQIAGIDNEDARAEAAGKLWKDLAREIETMRRSGVPVPEIMAQAVDLAGRYYHADGTVTTEELARRGQELHKLLSEAYKLDDGALARVLQWEPYKRLRAYLKETAKWKDESIDALIKRCKEKYPTGGKVYEAVRALNEQLAKTTAGSGLLKAADWADNAFAVYDAYMSGKTEDECRWNASLMMGRLGSQMALPSLQIPFALYDSFQSGSPVPLGMAVAFTYFPFAGQTYMVGAQCQRLDVAVRDNEFYGALSQMLGCVDFDTDGRIVLFKIYRGKQVIHDDTIAPPGDRKAIVELFEHPESPFWVEGGFRYWRALVPKDNDLFGRYEDKLERLRRFFAYSEEVGYRCVMLKQYRSDPASLPKDQYAGTREQVLLQMQDDLQKAVWVAMADMLEAAAKSVTQRATWEERIRKFEQDLALGDDQLGKGKGLLSQINLEIWKQSSWLKGENPCAVGLIFDRCIKAYTRLESIRTQIILYRWNQVFGIDYVVAQSDPLKILLNGPRNGAPQLSGDPDADLRLAEKCLADHTRRSQQIVADLAEALGRPVDRDKDTAHLKAFGRLGIEWEHLLDDCPDHLLSAGAPEVQAALLERSRAYKAYLAKLWAGRNGIEIVVEGTNAGPVGAEARFDAVVSAKTKEAEPFLREVRIEWVVDRLVVGDGVTCRFTPRRAGRYEVKAKAVRETPALREVLAAQSLAFEAFPTGGVVNAALALAGPDRAPAGQPLQLSAELKAREGTRASALKSLKIAWTLNGKPMGNGATLAYTPAQTGRYEFVATAVREATGGGAGRVACARHRVEVSAGAVAGQVELALDGPRQAAVNAAVTVTARLAARDPAGAVLLRDARVEWWLGGDLLHVGPTFGCSAAAPASYNLDVRAIRDDRGKAVVIGRKAHTLVFSGDKTPGADAPKSGGTATTVDASAAAADMPKGFWKYKETRTQRTLIDAENVTYTPSGRDGEIDSNYTIVWHPEDPQRRKVEEQKARFTWKLENDGKILVPGKPLRLTGQFSASKDYLWGIVDICKPEHIPSNLPDHSLRLGEWKAPGSSVNIDVELPIPERIPKSYAGTQAPFLDPRVGVCLCFHVANPEFHVDRIYEWVGNEPQGFGCTLLGVPQLVLKGESVELEAAVEGAGLQDAPFKYAWTGPVQGSGSCVRFKGDTPGKHKVACTATSRTGKQASASAEIEVVEISGRVVLPSAPIVVGAPVRLSAAILVNGRPAAPGAFTLQWQPHPEVVFEPFTSDQAYAATATFPRPGREVVWFVLLRKQDGRLVTVFEAEQAEVEVVPPELELKTVPAEPYVGQEVTVTVATRPPIAPAYLDFRWECAGNTLGHGPAPDSRTYVYTPKDPRPVTVKALARTPFHGDDLGAAQVSGEARLYEVKVSGPRLQGPPPLVWDPQKGGLVEVARAAGAFQDAFFRAEVGPAPGAAPLAYAWSVVPEGCSLSAPFSQETRANAGQAGSYELSVLVKDSRGIELGRGAGAFPVVASARETPPPPDKKESELRAQALVEAGYALEQGRQWQAAIAKYREALRLIPEQKLETRIRQLEQGLEADARAQRLVNEAYGLEQTGKTAEAVARYEEALRALPDAGVRKHVDELKARGAARGK